MAKSKRTKTKVPSSPRCLEGSIEARRIAVGLLEVLSGAKGPQEGSEYLGVSLNRYYQLETRGLQGLITALEPRPRGKAKSEARQLELAEAEGRRLKRELVRHQALLRAAERSLGLKIASRRKLAVGTDPKSGKKRRRVTAARATKVIAVLSAPRSPAESAS